MEKFDATALNEEILARRIPHGNFMAALKRGQELLSLRDYGMPGSGFMLVGKSGVGKTTLANALKDYAHEEYGADSVMKTQLTTGATVKGMLSSLLSAFGDPLSQRQTAQILAERLKRTITARKCRLIIIDETQHLLPGGKASPVLIDNILNSLKVLDETGVSFVLAGMESITLLWHADPQIRSRFQTTHRLQNLVYPDDQKAWHGIVRKYLETMDEHGVSIRCPKLEDRLYAATKGAMRPLVLILTHAVKLAYQAKTSTITIEHLRVAANQQIDKQDGEPNAFDLDYQRILAFNKTAHTSRKPAPVPTGLDQVLAT